VEPRKTHEEFSRERDEKVEALTLAGFLQSHRLRRALLAVPREEFIPRPYRDYAYQEVPLPLPGERATISCPHSYPLFYEPLGLDAGDRFLEVGLGSGYGAAVAREVVGTEGLVVSVELDPVTFAFGTANLERAGYRDLVLVNGDGGLGHPPAQPYDAIAVTAACRAIPGPLIAQLAPGGKVIAPIMAGASQRLILADKRPEGLQCREICSVLYVPLRGEFGT
jgi:protein-L-isoaspartate(D-aspartate) O-methyltransferase